MRLVKTEDVSLITRTIEIKRQSYFVITAMLGFNLDDPAVIWTETALWSTMMEPLGGENIIGGIFRPVAEVLLSGSCYAPRGVPVKAHRVRLVMGRVDKTLTVFGDRKWKKGPNGFIPTDPIPFTKMPIGFERAYGGPTYPKNPLGLGHDRLVDENGHEYLPLPNIEDPEHLITSPLDRPEPAGLGSLHPAWPQRAAKYGTFNADWLNKYWPGYPEDFDWHFFNKTPKDQWLKGWPQGDEPFTLEGVHPEGPIASNLPGKKIRVFITWTGKSQEDFFEVALNIDTVWFFPDQNLGLLCFRGIAPVQDDEASDIDYFYAAMEDLEAPKIVPIHFSEFKEIIAPSGSEEEIVEPSAEPSPEVAPSPEDLPPVLSAEDKEVISEMESKLAEAENNLAREMKNMGLDYDEIVGRASNEPGPVPPSLEEAEALFARALKEVGLEKLPEIPAVASTEGLNFDPRALAAAFKEANLLTPELEQEIWNMDREIKALPEGVFDTGPEAEKEPEPGIFRPALSREEAAAQYAQGRRDFSGLDLTGLDLSNMDFSGADFSRSNLNQADFTDAVLTRTVFLEALAQEALLVRAKMAEAVLTGADFSGADLSEADLNGVMAEDSTLARAKAVKALFRGACLERSVLAAIDLSEADLSQANLTRIVAPRAVLVGAVMKKARLDRADFAEADLTGADLTGIEALQPDFYKANFSGARLVEAVLFSANLDQTSLTGADLTRVQAPSLSLHGAGGEHAVFRSAQLENLRADSATALPAADFSEAELPRSYLGGARLEAADFSGAGITESTFQHCKLEGANFHLARAGGARFLKCDLTEAVITEVNLLFGSLAKSKCFRTDFRGSNMFGVDTLKTEFAESKLLNTNLKRTRIPGAGLT